MTATGPPVTDAKSLVDYAASLDCIHCGLCLPTCPTYRASGRESSSPRGRIHLMRAVAEERLAPDDEYADELDYCLVCRHCESVCPAGVRFGQMMERARDGPAGAPGVRRRGAPARLARWLGFRVLLPRRGPLRAAAALGRLAQTTGLAALAARLLGRRAEPLAQAPRIPPAAERARLPALTPAAGERRGGVAVLEGCVMPLLYGRVNRATVRTLAALGLDVHVPREHVCCGALHAHNGDLAGARALARRAIRAYEPLADASGPLPIAVNSAGCAAHMKEYAHLLRDDGAWSERGRRLAARVRDYSEVVAPRLDALPDAPGAGSAAARVRGPLTWDDPCHLCHAQGVREEPRAVLDRVTAARPGLARVELDESEACCGSAGLYSLLRPADSRAVLAPRLAALRASGARTLVTANPGCQLQWEAGVRRAGLDVDVVHLAELVDAVLVAGGRVAGVPVDGVAEAERG